MRVYGKRGDMLVHEASPFNAEPPSQALAGSPLTALDSFYVRNHGPVPEPPAEGWHVQVGGLVGRPLTVGLDGLRGGRFADRELVATLQCAGNRRTGLARVREIPGEAPWGPGATGTALWRGVALADVLEQAQVSALAQHVAFVGADRCADAEPEQPFGGSIPLAKACSEEVILAFEMNGEPLSAVHGGPVRVVVPGYIGARSVKWLERIELRREPWAGYFQRVAYRLLRPEQTPGPGIGIELGEVGLNADVFSPHAGAVLTAGRIEVSGYAFAGGAREVTRVDLTLDDGESWIDAELLADQGRWSWRLWRAEIELSAGDHELSVRAWDSAANTQPERPQSVWNPKGYMNSSWGRASLRATAAPDAG